MTPNSIYDCNWYPSSSAAELLCSFVGTRKRHGKPIYPGTRYVPHLVAYTRSSLSVLSHSRARQRRHLPLVRILVQQQAFQHPFCRTLHTIHHRLWTSFRNTSRRRIRVPSQPYVAPIGLFTHGTDFSSSVGAYCVFIVNTLVSIGLLLIHVKGYNAFQWDPPVRSPRSIVIAYFVSNVLLLIAPFIPPGEGRVIYQNLPYWVSKRRLCLRSRHVLTRCFHFLQSHAVSAFGVALIGLAYWYWFAVWHPRKWGYSLKKQLVVPARGVSRFQILKIPVDKPAPSGQVGG